MCERASRGQQKHLPSGLGAPIKPARASCSPSTGERTEARGGSPNAGLTPGSQAIWFAGTLPREHPQLAGCQGQDMEDDLTGKQSYGQPSPSF